MSWVSRIYNIRDFISAILPPPGDNEPPSVPGAPSVISLNATSLFVSFPASTDNVAVVEYQVQRSVNAGAWADLLYLTSPTTSFTDSGLTEGTTYAYRARARDAVPNWSAYGNSGSGVPTAPPVAGTVGVTLRTGAQLDLQEDRYSSAGRFLDLMKRSAEPTIVGAVTFREDGWIASMAPGAQVTFNIFLDCGPYSYIPDGDYVIKGGGTVTKSATGGPLTGTTTSASRAYFTIPYNTAGTSPIGYGNFSLGVRLYNDTGGTLTNVEGVVVCRLSDEALVDAGQIASPAMLTFYQHMHAIRSMACNNAMALPGAGCAWLPKTPDKLWTKNARSFVPNNCGGGRYNGGDGFVPYDAIAQVISQIGPKEWHVNMQTMCDALYFKAYESSNRVYVQMGDGAPNWEHGWAEGQKVYFHPDGAISGSGIPVSPTVLYVRNPDQYSFQLSTSPGGSIVDITRDCGNDYANFGAGYSYWRVSRYYTPTEVQAQYDAIAQQIFQNLTNPDVRIVIECGNEVGWNFGYAGNIMWYNAVSIFPEFVGAASASASLGLAHIQLRAFAAFAKFFPRYRLRFAMCGQAANSAFSEQGLQYVDPGLVLPGRKFCDIIDHFAVAFYYGTHEDPYHLNPAETYNDNYPTRLWEWWTYRTAWLQNDSWWYNAYQYTLSLTRQGLRDYLYGLPYKPGLWAYHNPTISFHSYETNVDQFINGFSGAISIPYTTEQALAQERFNALLNSATMRDIHQVHWNNMAAERVRTFQQFGTLGFYYRFFIGGWGLKNTLNDANNPRTEWYMGGASLPGRPNSIGTEKAVSRVMVSGHSLSSHTADSFFPALATYMGVSHQYERQIILGSPIKTRTGDQPTWTGFSLGNNVSGNNKNLLTEWASPTSVTGGTYTDLLITENHQILQNLRWNATHKYLMAYLEAFMTRSPGAQPYLWTCWHPGDDGLWDYTVQGWLHYERKMAHIWSSLAWRINLTAANKGYSWRLKVAPAAYCVASLVDRAVNGNLPGITQGSVQATIDLLFNDPAGNNVHMTTPQGLYYLGCLHMAIVHKKSPIGAPTPAGVTAEQAASLQQQAWRSLLEYVNLDEWEPDIIAHTRKFASEDGSTTYSDRMTPAADAGFFASSAYGSGNPYVFDAATDTANAGWFTAP